MEERQKRKKEEKSMHGNGISRLKLKRPSFCAVGMVVTVHSKS